MYENTMENLTYLILSIVLGCALCAALDWKEFRRIFCGKDDDDDDSGGGGLMQPVLVPVRVHRY
ncbi:hypothetical protein BH10CYA1_BH10CYA1_53490 [soil metagenome]